MIAWLLDLLSGRVFHWQRGNGAYITALHERAKTLPPSIGQLLINFSDASYVVVDAIFEPEDRSKAIIKKDLKATVGELFLV